MSLSRPFPVKTAIVLLVVAIVAAVLSSRKAVFDGPDKDRDEALLEISKKCRADGMLRALSFDGPFLRDWARGCKVEQTGTESIPGTVDGARRFRPDRDALINPDLLWSSLPSNSFSALLRLAIPPDAPANQDLCFSDGFEQKTGFALRDGRLCFFIPTETGFERLSVPFPKTGRYMSALAVVDGDGGQATLYLDGAEADSRAVGTVRLPRSHILFRTKTWHPISADLDEFVLWARSLSEKEAKRASQPGFCPIAHAAASATRRYRAAVLRGRLLRGALRAVERFDPSAMAAESRRLPLLTLRTKTSVQRKLAAEHEASLRNGERTRKGGEFRPCRLVTKAGVHVANVCLDDVYTDERRSRRPSYVVSLDGFENDPAGLFRLYPPEDHAVLHRGDPQPFPLAEDDYVRLSVNGGFPAVYCIEPLVRIGNARLSDLRPASLRSPALASPIRPILDAERLDEAAVRRLFRERVRLIVSDPRSEWGTREWKLRAHRIREEAAAKSFRPPAVSELDALGTNEAPFWITSDLVLTNAAFVGVARWHSSRPELIDGEGRVRRPDGDLPQVVELVPEGLDGSAPKGIPTLRFRVVPKRPRLGALMVYVSTPVRKIRRCDFVAILHPAGGGEPRVLRGTGGMGGGIRHRGNTSYVKSARKPFSLRFDIPLADAGLGDAPGRILHLYGGYADPTRIRSRLSMDSFRLMDDEGRNHFCEEIVWLEVFMNGQYYGVYEAGTRDNRELLPPDSADELFKLDSILPLFRRSSSFHYVQLRPHVEENSREASLLELMDPILAPGDDAFREWAVRNVDLENFVDYMLLLNFTGSYDAVNSNLCIGREGGGDRRFYIIPRDYDRSFLPNRADTWLGNPLDARLRRCLPEYRGRMAKRWAQLRTGPFSDEAVGAQIDAYIAELDGYMEEEYRLLGLNRDFRAEAEALRKMALARLQLVDQEVGKRP